MEAMVISTTIKISLSCLLLFFVTDLLFGAFLNKQRVYVWNPDYHHGLTPNFYDASSWGDENFNMVTK